MDPIPLLSKIGGYIPHLPRIYAYETNAWGSEGDVPPQKLEDFLFFFKMN